MADETPTHFKVLEPDGKTVGSGGAPITAWPLPKRREDGAWEPGAWTKTVRSPDCCARGWHLATRPGLLEWMREGAVIYAAEGAGAGEERVYDDVAATRGVRAAA